MHKTLTEFLIEEQRKAPGATGGFTALVKDVGLACKRVSHLVGKGALGGALGEAGTANVQGERQMNLDVLADDIFRRTLERGGTLEALASEEREHAYPVPAEYPRGQYLLAVDPLDGSSNIEVNAPVGSCARRISCSPERSRYAPATPSTARAPCWC
jgi:fructose-1,6-bisphosphatase